MLKLIVRDTLEERIDEIIESKRRLAADLVAEDDPSLVKVFTRDELRALLHG